MDSNPAISVVVPVFGTGNELPELIKRLEIVLRPFGAFEVILVDDGSPESTWAVVRDLADRNSWVIGLRLGRNYGQHNALIAGVRAARSPLVVTIDDDLQNPPEEIPKLLNHLATHNLDVVYGVPQVVSQSLGRRWAGKLTRMSLSNGLGASSASDISSFRVFRTQLREAFSPDLGTNVSLDALLTWGGGRFGSCEVQHDPRKTGRSNYTLGKLIRFAIDTTTGYSTVPLQVATVLGLVTAAFGFVLLSVVIVRLIITGESVPGFPFLASVISIFSGAQLLTLGIVGEYLARMHFRIMRKPTYFIAESAGGKRES